MGASGSDPSEQEPLPTASTFRQAFASANTGMCLVSAEGRLLEVNGRMSEIFGYGKSELERMSVNDLALADDLDLSPRYIHRALEGGDPCTVFEKRYRHRDGSVVHAVVSSNLVRDDQGRPLCFVSLVQDISERKCQEATLLRQRQQLSEANRFLAEARDALAQDRARLAAILDALLDPHLLLEPERDAEGRIVDFHCLEANAAASIDTRRTKEQLQGLSLRRLLPVVPPAQWLEPCRAVFETGRPLVLDDIPDAHRPDGEERRLDIRVVKVGEALSVSWRDVSERYRAARRLVISEEHYRLLAENARDVIWTMAPDGTITSVSQAVESLRGLTPEEAMAQPIEQIHPPDSLAISRGYFRQLADDLQAGRPLQPFRGELEYYCRDGSTVWMDVMALPVLDAQGQFIELLGVSRDITERKRTALELQQAREAAETANRALQAANRQLERLAITDELTGLWNRRHLDERLHREIDRADRYGDDLSMVLFDIDHFKAINDRFGHLAGDRVLEEVAHRVQTRLRRSDGLGRWGGEEFLVLLPRSSARAAARMAERLRRVVEAEPFKAVGRVTISAGVALRRPRESAEDWFRRLDRLMYRAKERGRNRVERDPEAGAGGAMASPL